MFTNSRTGLLLISTAFILTSCGVATFIEDGPLPAPREQAESSPALPGAFSQSVQARYDHGYGQFFNSAELNALIAEAAANNPDYLLLRARVDREVLRIADKRLNGGPSLSASISDVEKYGAVEASSYSLSVDLNPALDIWGKTAADIRAGVLGSQASLFDLVASERALQKTIVRTWADLIAARTTLQQRYARHDAYNDILDATRREVIDGTRAAIDLQLAEIDVLGAKNQLEVQRSQVQVAESNLNRLLGRQVGEPVRLSSGVLPRFAGTPPSRLPSELLTRRPDVQAAWARLVAADETFKSARLAMLPRFNLTGSTGNTTADFANLLDPDFFISSLITSLTATLLDNGTSKRAADIALASVEVELHNYTATVMDAMVEVHSILQKEHSLKHQIAIQKESASLASDAFTQELSAMRDGSASLREVSQAALRLYNSEDEIVSLRNRILQNRLDLYLALGDDYFDGESE